MTITPEILDQHNVTPEEYERIIQLMGREPNLTELGIFSVMWSEHCSYKSSKVHLRRLPTEGKCLVQGPGENAGIVDIGDGWCAAFKIESHNHPSFIEPYQGAATGVGGILRDIFTMGARPVAAMNSLRFGPIRDEDIKDEESRRVVLRNRRIMTGVVKGLGDYGNCLTGNEGIVIKENDRIRWLTIGEFCERFASNLPEASLEVDGFGIQALSFDEAAHKPVWSLVRRIFKRHADRTLNIKTRKGRALRVTPDHPMLTCSEKGWQTILAKDLVPGSKIPILTSLPEKSESLNKKLELEMDGANGTQYSFPLHTQRDGYAEVKVIEVQELNAPATVYDLEVEDTHNFVTSGGIITHNCFGVPTVGGEVAFADCYSLNPLVNAFALGLVRREHIFYGKAEGIGNSVIYVGAKTGRDGIHGATMASAEFDEAAMEKRPTVQVGDPFSEKLLLEACLEAMRAGAIVGIQDMGAAGLTSSSCEMGARAGTGLEIDLDLVPQREAGMTAYEMMLSESQERMLIVAKRGHERQLMEIFHRWDLDAVVIGQVIAEERLRALHKGEVVADIPTKALTDGAPRYNRPQRPFAISNEDVTPKIEAAISNLKSQISDLKSEIGDESQVFTEILRRLVASPNLASKQWVYRQYDHMVRTNTVVTPGSDAAALRVKETRRSLAMSLDCNGRYCHLNPREGAKLAVAEAARNVACSGARPLAITNCLNFASPERPEVMWAFSETIDGMAEACRALGTPVTGGNVSFYNETEGEGVYPTPVIGMLGLIEDARHTTTHWFKEAGDVILLLGATRNDLGATELLSVMAGEARGAVPRLDLAAEKAVQKVCLEAIQAGLVSSAHDCSDGGLAVALAESCFSSYRRRRVGARIDLSEHAKLCGLGDAPALLFGESPSRIIISLKPEHVSEVENIAQVAGVVCAVIGEADGEELSVACDGESLIEVTVASLEETWRGALPSHLDRPV